VTDRSLDVPMNRSHWTLRVTATDQEAAHVFARRHRFAVGRPLHFDAGYSHVTALEYVLGALGAEIVNGLRLAARGRRITLDDIEAVVDGQLDNPLAYLEVIGVKGQPRLKAVVVTVYLASPHDEQTLSTLWDQTRARLPLVQTFSGALALTVDVRFAAA